MSQPPPYSPVTSFITYQAQQAWFPGQQLDVEFNAIQTSIAAIEANLELIQNDDGTLENGIVGFPQLSTTLATALAAIGVAVPISTVLTQPNTWTGLQTFTNGISAPTMLPHLSASVEGTGFPGMDGVTGGVNWFLWNAPGLTSTNAAAPTLRVDRAASGAGGTPGNVVPTLWVNTTTASGDNNFSWGILTQLLNNSTTAAQQVAIAAFATRALGGTSPTFGGNISVADNNSAADPTVGLVGLEVDCGVANTLNGGTDTNANRVVLNVVGGGAAGSHVGHGIRLSGLTGVILDRGITYRPGPSFGVGLDFADATVNSASIFLAATQKIVFDGSWSGQTPIFNRSLNFQSGFLVYTSSGLQTMAVGDNGVFSINGINTAGNVSINAVNGAASTTAAAFAVLKAGFDTTTHFIQMYMQGGSPPVGVLASTNALVLNPTTSLQFQSNSVAIGDYGLTTASAWTLAAATAVTNATAASSLTTGAFIVSGGIGIAKTSYIASIIATLAGGLQVGAPTGGDKGAGTLNLAGALFTSGTQVVSTRATGWTVATGTPQRSTFTTGGVTLAQLAGVVMALEQDLIAHGLIGA